MDVIGVIQMPLGLVIGAMMMMTLLQKICVVPVEVVRMSAEI